MCRTLPLLGATGSSAFPHRQPQTAFPLSLGSFKAVTNLIRLNMFSYELNVTNKSEGYESHSRPRNHYSVLGQSKSTATDHSTYGAPPHKLSYRNSAENNSPGETNSRNCRQSCRAQTPDSTNKIRLMIPKLCVRLSRLQF